MNPYMEELLKREILDELRERDSKISFLEARVAQLENLLTGIIKTSMEHIIVDIVID